MKNPELRRNISFNHLTYFLLLLFNVLICVGHEKEKNDENIIFIVNSKNPATEINIADVRDYYFKIKRSWPDGENVRFIDRSLSAVVATGVIISPLPLVTRVVPATSTDVSIP